MASYVDLDKQDDAKLAKAPQSSPPAPPAAGAETGSSLTKVLASPVVSSALTGLGIWRIAKGLGVQPRHAAQTGFVVFGLSIGAKYLQRYLKDKAGELERGAVK